MILLLGLVICVFADTLIIFNLVITIILFNALRTIDRQNHVSNCWLTVLILIRFLLALLSWYAHILAVFVVSNFVGRARTNALSSAVVEHFAVFTRHAHFRVRINSSTIVHAAARFGVPVLCVCAVRTIRCLSVAVIALSCNSQIKGYHLIIGVVQIGISFTLK